jgi:hypothetical protein
MTDTRNFVTCFEKPIETKPSTDTDEVLESYLKILNDIMDEEEYNTIVETNYKGANHERTSK